jgi:hypothetical protein
MRGLQILVNGSCFDRSKCTTYSTCNNLVNDPDGLDTYFTGPETWPQSLYSLAEKWYPPGGPYTVLVRLENRMGCGVGGITSCYRWARAAFKLLQSGWPDAASGHHQ